MFVEPNSTVYLFKNIHLDKEHHHTLYFTSRQEQNVYFTNAGRVYKVLVKYNYVRETRAIRVTLNNIEDNITFGDLYTCNYLRYKNTSCYDKWFYAFIDKIEYVNNNAADVYFTIDPMQTWLIDLDYHSDLCFIEREHAIRDRIGDNLIPEKLDVGEYVYGSKAKIRVAGTNTEVDLTECKLVVAMPEQYVYMTDNQWHFVPMSSACWGFGNAAGLCYTSFENTNAGWRSFKAFMEKVQDEGKVDEIFAIFWYPKFFVDMAAISLYNGEIMNDPNWNTYQQRAWSTIKISADYGTDGDTVPVMSDFNIDGYSPKNNKLYTYPYNFLYVSTPNAQKVLKYEYFANGFDLTEKGGGACNFLIFGAISPNASVIAYPLQYKGSTFRDIDESVTISGYPIVPYNSDLAKAYSAQWNASFGWRELGWMVGAMSSIPQVVAGVATGNPVAAINGAMASASSPINDIIQYNMRLSELEVAPMRTSGNASDVTAFQAQAYDMMFINKHIRAEYARIIDDYFTMFGYACNQVKEVSAHNRRFYTYVKTANAHLIATLPRDVEEEICSILNNGVTFWTSDSDFGNYNIPNPPLNQ